MTIATTTSTVTASGNGSTTVFPYTFYIPNAASVIVTYTDALGVATQLLPSQFAITGLGSATGGNVTYPLAGSPIASGTKLTITRTVPYTQPTSLVAQGGYYPGAVEAALDNLEMQIQQLASSVTSGASGVSSFNARTGAITLASVDVTSALGFTPLNPANNLSDVANAVVARANLGLGTMAVETAANYALLASPDFTGIPTAPTAAAGTNTTQIATTAFVIANAVSAGVASFNTRVGAITLTSADVTGALTYTPLNIAQNLADVANVTTARSNLGLGAFAVLGALTGPITANASGATAVASQTGTGTTFAMQAGPTFTGSITYSPNPGSGTRTIQARLGEFLSVKDFGAVGDGVTDDTAAINEALLAISATGAVPFGQLYFPPGTYLVSSALQAFTGCVLIGDNPIHTIIKRTATHTQDTLIVGQNTPGFHADAFYISGIQFLRPITFNGGQAYVPGTSTSVDNRLTGGQTHMRIWYGQDALIEKCLFYDMPFNVISVASTITTFRRCSFGGSIWDNLTPAMQEGMGQLYLQNGAGSNTLITVDDCYFSGKYSSPTRTVNVGTATPSFAYGVGSLSGILVDGVEGLCITNNYFGGQNGSCLNFTIQNTGGVISSNIKIIGNFFDGAFNNEIFFGQAVAGIASVFVTINSNVFNGELSTGRHIYVDSPNSQPTVYNLVVDGNTMMGSYYCAMYFIGAYGARVANNVVSDYNHYGGNTGVPNGSAGLFVVGASDKVFSSCNQWGGGTNTLGATNNCQWGVNFTGPFTFGCAATGEQSMGLGLAGGALVNVAQSYPA